VADAMIKALMSTPKVGWSPQRRKQGAGTVGGICPPRESIPVAPVLPV